MDQLTPQGRWSVKGKQPQPAMPAVVLKAAYAHEVRRSMWSGSMQAKACRKHRTRRVSIADPACPDLGLVRGRANNIWNGNNNNNNSSNDRTTNRSSYKERLTPAAIYQHRLSHVVSISAGYRSRTCPRSKSRMRLLNCEVRFFWTVMAQTPDVEIPRS